MLGGPPTAGCTGGTVPLLGVGPEAPEPRPTSDGTITPRLVERGGGGRPASRGCSAAVGACGGGAERAPHASPVESAAAATNAQASPFGLWSGMSRKRRGRVDGAKALAVTADAA